MKASEKLVVEFLEFEPSYQLASLANIGGCSDLYSARRVEDDALGAECGRISEGLLGQN